MISLSRVGNNLLFLGIIAAIGYMIYMKLKNKDIKDKIRGVFSRESIEKMKPGKVRWGGGKI